MSGDLAAVLGAAGGWLLVAGPIYQASVEFGEFETKHRELGVDDLPVPAAPPMNAWWWLLPPVGAVLQVRRARNRRDALRDAAPSEAVQAYGAYADLAVGWVIVAAGALLIAGEETLDLAELQHWPLWLSLTLPPVLLALSALFAALRTRTGRRTERRRRP